MNYDCYNLTNVPIINKIKMNTPWKKLKRREQEIILYGSDEIIHFKYSIFELYSVCNSNNYYKCIISK